MHTEHTHMTFIRVPRLAERLSDGDHHRGDHQLRQSDDVQRGALITVGGEVIVGGGGYVPRLSMQYVQCNSLQQNNK